MSTGPGPGGATAYAGAPGQVCPHTLRLRRVVATGGLALILGVTNLVAAPRLRPVPSAAWNLGATAVVLGLGRWTGVDRTAVGLDPRRLRALLDPDLRSVPLNIGVPALVFGAWRVVSGRDFVGPDAPDGQCVGHGGRPVGGSAPVTAADHMRMSQTHPMPEGGYPAPAEG